MKFFSSIFKRPTKRRSARKAKRSIFRNPKLIRPRRHLSFAQNKSFELKQIKKKRFKGNIKVHNRQNLKRWTYIILTGVSVGSAVFILFFSNFFKLSKWEVEENGVSYYNHFLGKYLQEYSQSNLFFVDTEAITANIQTNHPNIAYLKVSKVFPNKIKITIEQYPLAANLIIETIPENLIQQAIVNSQGNIVALDSQNDELPSIKIQNDKFFSLLDQAIKPDQLSFAIQTINEFEKSFGLKIKEIYLKPKEREVHILTEKDFWIWLDLEESSDKQFLKLKRASGLLDIYNTPLQYIDLRIKGVENDKVIFKRR